MNAFACLALGLACCGQAANDEAAAKRLLLPYYARLAADCDFYLDDQRDQRLELDPRPVLTWTNADNYMGAVFVWTYRGRPEMIGCIGSHQFKPRQSNVFREFHSLSLQPMPPVTFDDGRKWTPGKPGVRLSAVDAAPRPADSDRLRLAQMRNLAREFEGWMKDGDDVAQLRLLPQPIARYQAPVRGVVDGAIFAMVWKGTDPEVLLIVEDRQADAERRWEYALARFNYREMWVKRRDREVWRVEVEATSDVYLTSNVGEINLDELETSSSKQEGSPPKP